MYSQHNFSLINYLKTVRQKKSNENRQVSFSSVFLWNIFHSDKYLGSSYSQTCACTHLQLKHPSQLLTNFNQNQNVPTNFSTTIPKCVKIHSADLKLPHADGQDVLIYECSRQNILNYLFFIIHISSSLH
jgi:hypothetical protein